MSVEKIIVLGKEIKLPTKIEESDIKRNILSLLKEIDPKLADDLRSIEYSIRIEGKIAVVYRLGAVFG